MWPDTRRVREHQAFIRALPCVACGNPAPSECAQVRGSTDDGMGNRHLVPLCGPTTVWNDCCHSRQHHLGAVHFWSALGIDPLGLACRLWRISGDRDAGEQSVRRARQASARHRGDMRETRA
jgi:hypothetical protein